MSTISDTVEEIDGGGFRVAQEKMNTAMRRFIADKEDHSDQNYNRDDKDK